mmetsp:Transcript_12374/g.18770  ORF Transcript_12374/g.18770 Transcript_12374/m.18770 type:complete len:296 (+) Transcript_12374:82-969(+)
MSMLTEAYWMTDGDYEHLRHILPKFSQYACEYKSHSRMKEFRWNKSIAMIYTSNKLEGTLPKSAQEHETYRILSELFAGSEIDTHLTENWKADGETSDGCVSKAQMIHHLNAYRYLCETQTDGKYLYERELSSEIILRAHQLLMQNATYENGERIPHGYRTHSVHAGDYVYLSHEYIAPSVEKIVRAFNYDKKVGEKNPIIIAANLFYDLITVHPFADGNGRLCRLLAAFALLSVGVPFPVSLTSGRSRSRRHYIDCILKARRMGSDRKYLYTLFATSVELGWSNFIGNLYFECV